MDEGSSQGREPASTARFQLVTASIALPSLGWPTVRYLVETSSGELSFSIERDKPLEKGLTFTQEGSTYIARFIEPGRDDFDGVIKAEWMGKGDFPRAGARPKTEGR
jgi:hypothetical protein